jgi:hypothetical protein
MRLGGSAHRPIDGDVSVPNCRGLTRYPWICGIAVPYVPLPATGLTEFSRWHQLPTLDLWSGLGAVVCPYPCPARHCVHRPVGEADTGLALLPMCTLLSARRSHCVRQASLNRPSRCCRAQARQDMPIYPPESTSRCDAE